MSEELESSLRRKRDDGLQLGPRKRPYVDRLDDGFYSLRALSLFRSVADPLVHHGRHFGRAVYALCNFQVLLTNGLLRIGELANVSEENFTAEWVAFLLPDNGEVDRKVFTGRGANIASFKSSSGRFQVWKNA